MNNPERPRMSKKQEEAARFIRRFGRRFPARATLRELAAGLGGVTERVAKGHLDGLVAKGYATRVPHVGRGVVLTDEREIPVILVKERVDPAEPLLGENRIMESIRGVLADSFDPEPDFLVVVENRSGYSRMLAVCQHADGSEGDTVVGRIGDEIIVGKLSSGYVELEHGTCKTEGALSRIARGARDFRLEGIVTGEVTAKTTARKP